MRLHSAVVASCLSPFVALAANALTLDPDGVDSVKSAAKSVAHVLISQYDGNQTGNPIGIYGPPYYWWSSGVIWDAMVDYWSLTSDTTYNDLVHQALVAQLGPNNDFLPPNQTATMGNDDQSFWAFGALTAAERNFTAPTAGHSWLEVASAVFEEQTQRWDETTCGGGLRWQIPPFNVGYDYKNSATNANFFQLAARLARITGNQTYVQWAEKSYNWLTTVGFITEGGAVYDGAKVEAECAAINKYQFSSNAGVLLYGSALMYNLTSGNSTWTKAVTAILNETASVFLKDGFVTEVACETTGKCTVDMHFFKGILARDLARTARVAPFTANTISPLLKSNANAAATAGCSNSNGSCGFRWGDDKTNDVQDVGSQYAALAAIQAVLSPVQGLSSSGTGNTTSGGNPTTGQNSTGKNAGGSLRYEMRSISGLWYAAALLSAELLFLGIF